MIGMGVATVTVDRPEVYYVVSARTLYWLMLNSRTILLTLVVKTPLPAAVSCECLHASITCLYSVLYAAACGHGR